MPWPGRLVDAVGPSVEQLAISDSRRAFADAPPENAAILVTFSSIPKMQTMSKVVTMPGSSFLPGFAILHGHPTQPRRKRKRRNYQCATLTRTCRCVSEDKRELAGTGVPPGLQSQCQADRSCPALECPELDSFAHEYELDTPGCPICACRNPCVVINFRSKKETIYT